MKEITSSFSPKPLPEPCKECGKPLEHGQLVRGFDFTNEGDRHIDCSALAMGAGA